jgi:hypothetical protein
VRQLILLLSGKRLIALFDNKSRINYNLHLEEAKKAVAGQKNN